ncbi:hypothetical protein ACLOJK_013999 [Asimina triloba]
MPFLQLCPGFSERKLVPRTSELLTSKGHQHPHSKEVSKLELSAQGSVSSYKEVKEDTMKEKDETVFHDSQNEVVGLPGTHRSIPLECMNDSLHGCWKSVLENILQTSDVSEGVLGSCIRDALLSRQSRCISEPKRHSINQNADRKEPIYQNGNVPKNCTESTIETEISNNSGKAVVEHEQVFFDGSQKVTNGVANGHAVTDQCRSIFLDVIVSDKFLFLCNFLYGNFQGIKTGSLLDFSTINLRMKNGHYEQSSELFASDIEQGNAQPYELMFLMTNSKYRQYALAVKCAPEDCPGIGIWKKFEKIGEEMVHIAKNLSNMSRASYQQQMGELMEVASEGKGKEIVVIEQRDSAVVDSSKQFPSSELNLSTKPGQTEACGSQKLCTCRQCGAAEADGERRIICDGCEAMYHITCIKPSLEGDPPQIWYCAACCENGKRWTHNPGDCSHWNCKVCDRLDDPAVQKWRCRNDVIAELLNDSEETSDGSSTESSRQPDVSRGCASSLLCKICKRGEQDNMKFKICEHEHCPYKFYHSMCLRSKQMDCPHSRWYCPSCLCRSCLFDKDDDKIVLCDGCDEAYHIYCAVPPLKLIPKGKWYCMFCTIEIKARRRMRLKIDEARMKKQKGNAKRGNGAAGSVDMLLSAAEKLSSEEQPVGPAARRKNR